MSCNGSQVARSDEPDIVILLCSKGSVMPKTGSEKQIARVGYSDSGIYQASKKCPHQRKSRSTREEQLYLCDPGAQKRPHQKLEALEFGLDDYEREV